MAFHDGYLPRVPIAAVLMRKLRGLLRTPFDDRVNERAARVAELRAMSDAELSALGLSRDEILRHVFRRRGGGRRG